MSGEVDLCGVSEFATAVYAALRQARWSRRLVVDLREVTLFGAAGLHVLDDLQFRCTREAVRLWVLASDAAVIGPLRATGLDKHLCVVAADACHTGRGR
ncbi:STAS domain-containing protein [Nocardia sp. CDC159]|uniref:STAS domain-containing protein n=1 Tax=Nocardia pulmonis TaxID=2951408 RepID=A0A9X2ECW8_9NOCA|nr:STAS domain-containing protein [Nocardia pulmonis]MCM6791476.1 STAS domain-containing protein [Nocardia sp. CDC159]